jgi:hypothetical protein
MHHTTVTELICTQTELNCKYRECDGKLAVIKITRAPRKHKGVLAINVANTPFVLVGCLYDNTTARSLCTAK